MHAELLTFCCKTLFNAIGGAISNCKIVETSAIFSVIFDILIVNMHLPPSSHFNVVLVVLVFSDWRNWL